MEEHLPPQVQWRMDKQNLGANFRLRLAVPSKGGTVLHEFRGGEIRVDRVTRRKAAAAAGKRTAGGKGQ